MVAHEGSKVTHHCWCGKTGRCRKHIERCNIHQTDFYAGGGCMGCNRMEKLKVQQERKDAENQRKLKSEADKKAKDAASYGRPKGAK